MQDIEWIGEFAEPAIPPMAVRKLKERRQQHADCGIRLILVFEKIPWQEEEKANQSSRQRRAPGVADVEQITGPVDQRAIKEQPDLEWKKAVIRRLAVPAEMISQIPKTLGATGQRRDQQKVSPEDERGDQIKCQFDG
jgi:hypothetical protein